MAEILGAIELKTNAELIEYVQPLYIPLGAHVCDATWGKGNWWTRYQPDQFTAHDLYTLDGVDYRNLPEADDTYGVVCFDPPYVSKGGRETSGIKSFDAAYGLKDAPKSPELMHRYNAIGLTECVRVCKPGGYVLVKCMSYVSSGKVQWAPRWIANYAEGALPVEHVDEFIHTSGVRPQPPGRGQYHARRNYSHLLVFKKVSR